MGWREWYAGSWGCPVPPLLELSGLDCRVSIVIETLLCENHRGFPLSRNTGHLFWDMGYPESPFSTGQTEVLRASLSLQCRFGVDVATLLRPGLT